MRHTVFFGLVALCSGLLAAAPASAIDLTGTWVGTQVCQYFDGRSVSFRFPNDVLLISQSGSDLSFVSGLVGLPFRAQVIEDDRSPATKAQAVFIACETTDSSAYQELGRAGKLEINPRSPKGDFEAASNFFQNDPDGFRFMGTCQWTYRRTSAADPGVEGCDAASGFAATLKAPTGRARP